MRNSADPAQASRAIGQWLFVCYVLFVVYGSLVPLRYVDRPLADAVQAFRNIPFLALGVESRADWVANGVLYVPVGFLTAGWLIGRLRDAPRALLFCIAGAFSVALAVSVEFAQVYFPQRTVSLNDIYAEWIGSLLGIALSVRYASGFQALVASFLRDPGRLRAAALDGYVVAYLAFAFFPYDLLLTQPELVEKVASTHWGWWVAGDTFTPVHLAFQLLAELLLTLPLGFWLVRLFGPGALDYRQAALVGLMLGAFIELGQFLLYSGLSQGVSVVSRALGTTLGLVLCQRGAHWSVGAVVLTLRRYTLPLVATYLMALLYLNGWATARWHGWSGVQAQWDQLRFMPFYYHYFTSEVKALFSVAVVSLSYAPVGILVWAHSRTPFYALALALVLATGIEAGKLFMDGTHPDPTNVVLACVSSGVVVYLLRQFFRRAPASVSAAPAVRSPGLHYPSIDGTGICLFFCLTAAFAWVAVFPVFSVLLILLLLGCAVAVWQRPVWVFSIIAAALPVLDLAPWSGRFFVDEFDALLLVVLGVACVRLPKGTRARPDFLPAMVGMLVALGYAISTVRGALPFQPPDVNAFNTYYSPYNALRIGKGALWGFLAWGLFRRFEAAGEDVRRPLAWGLVLGLGATVAVILWERVAFSGLWNFSDGYRVTGPFSAMHTGGAYIECFLAVATPFLMVLLLEKRPWLLRLAGVLLLLASTYALMVTFSRNGYAAFVVAVAIVLLLSLVHARRMVRGGVIFGVLAGAMLLVAIPIFKGDFAQARMATVRADLAVRQAHWSEALNMRDADWGTLLFGMGSGRYPETNYWRSDGTHRSGTYRFEVEQGNTYLRLGSGNSIYVEQKVPLVPGQYYLLKLEVRPSVPNARITVPICEKWMLTSYNCIWLTLDLGKEFGAWRGVERRFDANELTVSPWYSQRPTKLSLYYPTPNSTIDIDNVRLETQSGANLLRNGDFAHGLDHWFFATDGHLQWHIKSLYYGVLFDQGWFGLLAVLAMVLLAWVRAAGNAVKGDLVAGASLAALSSFLVVGVFDTLLDTPRFVLLLLLLVAACFHSAPPARSSA